MKLLPDPEVAAWLAEVRAALLGPRKEHGWKKALADLHPADASIETNFVQADATIREEDI